jgi:hypothetical protein
VWQQKVDNRRFVANQVLVRGRGVSPQIDHAQETGEEGAVARLAQELEASCHQRMAAASFGATSARVVDQRHTVEAHADANVVATQDLEYRHVEQRSVGLHLEIELHTTRQLGAQCRAHELEVVGPDEEGLAAVQRDVDLRDPVDSDVLGHARRSLHDRAAGHPRRLVSPPLVG